MPAVDLVLIAQGEKPGPTRMSATKDRAPAPLSRRRRVVDEANGLLQADAVSAARLAHVTVVERRVAALRSGVALVVAGVAGVRNLRVAARVATGVRARVGTRVCARVATGVRARVA